MLHIEYAEVKKMFSTWISEQKTVSVQMLIQWTLLIKRTKKAPFLSDLNVDKDFLKQITNLRVKFKFKQDINFVIEIEQQITIKENTVH